MVEKSLQEERADRAVLVSAPPWEPPPLDGEPSPGLGASHPSSGSAPFALVCFHGPASALLGSPLRFIGMEEPTQQMPAGDHP